MAQTVVRRLRDAGCSAHVFGGLGCALRAEGITSAWKWLPARKSDVDVSVCSGSNITALKVVEGIAQPCTCEEHKEHKNSPTRFLHDVWVGEERVHVDVYWGPAVRFNHEIRISSCSSLDIPAQAADLLLTKLQIHAKKSTDWFDLLMLLAALPLTRDTSGIDHRVVTDHCSRGTAAWGLARICLQSLAELRRLDLLDLLSTHERTQVLERAGELEGYIVRANKSVGWRVRAVFGTRLPWYSVAD